MGASIAAGPHTTSTCLPGGAYVADLACGLPDAFRGAKPLGCCRSVLSPGSAALLPAAVRSHCGDACAITVRSCRRAALLQDRCGWPSVGVASSSQRRSRQVGRPPAKGRVGMTASSFHFIRAGWRHEPSPHGLVESAGGHPVSAHNSPQVRALASHPRVPAEWLRCKPTMLGSMCEISCDFSGLRHSFRPMSRSRQAKAAPHLRVAQAKNAGVIHNPRTFRWIVLDERRNARKFNDPAEPASASAVR